MGKNGKKVKSDRINAVRKQYDAFLEEDRKRKDRNEYILERLDKMRSCTAVVPVRHSQTTNVFDNLEKTHMYASRIPTYDKPRFNSNQFHNSTLLTTLNEEALVKELSKKYILIPKQRTIDFEYNYPTKSSAENVNDWRSKYSILEELKKSEKEENNNFVPNKETLSNTIDFRDDNDTKVKVDDKPDNPEFIIKSNDNLQNYSNQPSLNTNTEIIAQNIEIFDTTEQSQHNSIQNKHLENEASEFNNNIDSLYQSNDNLTEKEKIQTKYELECKPESEENCAENIYNSQYPNKDARWQEEVEESPKSDFNEQKEINEQLLQSDINLENPKYEVESHELDVRDDGYDQKVEQSHPEVNLESKAIEPEMLNNPNAHQVQSNEEAVQEVTKEEINAETSVVDNQQMQPEITENVSPQVEVEQGQYQEHQTNSQQEYEGSDYDTQIQDFENEQTNMFYSEQTENYAYDQTGNVENTAGEYANNEGYEHNENYAYYEETPNSQAYSNEINEHEESTEQYDPNYQSQYENYAQEDLQPETVQEYTTEQYNTEQNFDQAIYEKTNYDAVEEVQQHLDDEEGYTKPLEKEGKLQDNSPKEDMLEKPIFEQEVKVTSS